MQSILLFGKSQQRRIGWTNLLASQFNSETTIATLTALHQTVNLVLFNAERIIVVWIAAKKIVGGDFTVGMLFAFLSFKEQFTQRVSSLIDKIAEMRMLRTHGDRVADVVFSEPEEVAISDIIEDRTLIAGSLELQNICFRYSMNDPYVFENINLSILEGESVAITGPSGGGKTTLVKVMLGLLRPSSGQILLGGIDIRTLGLSRFRAVIGTVMQDDHLFAGTIGDNISFFDPEPDLARIESSAKKASIFAEITAMPMGFRSVVGDLGSGLSGGQQQRILLARALYKQPQILVLDEATSHLDVQNELSVNGSLADLALTKIVVAHRKETIQMCDRVVYLLDGGLKEVSFNARTA